jgi:hypothetical protein
MHRLRDQFRRVIDNLLQRPWAASLIHENGKVVGYIACKESPFFVPLDATEHVSDETAALGESPHNVGGAKGAEPE